MSILKVTKIANTEYLFLGECNVLSYKIEVENTSNEIARAVILKDLLSTSAKIISNSVRVNGRRSYIEENSIISLGNIKGKEKIVITYDVYIPQNYLKDRVGNKVIVSYFRKFNNSIPIREYSESNLFLVQVIKIAIKIEKKVDKCVAKIGDYLTYQIIIKNYSNIKLKDIVFCDDILNNREITSLENFIVNGMEKEVARLECVPLGITINSCDEIEIYIRIKIKKSPLKEVIFNRASIEFNYEIEKIGFKSTGVSKSNEVCTKIIRCN